MMIPGIVCLHPDSRKISHKTNGKPLDQIELDQGQPGENTTMPETVLYVTATQAARLIGVNERTIRLWISQNKLSALQPAPNRLEIPMSEVDRIIEERQA